MTLPEVQDSMAIFVLQPSPKGCGNAWRERLDEAQGVATTIHLVPLGYAVDCGGTRCVPAVLLGQLGKQWCVVPLLQWRLLRFLCTASSHERPTL
jgi:hypothetical protein